MVLFYVPPACYIFCFIFFPEAVDEYKPPFFEWVEDNVTTEEMKNVVITERKRPEIPERWSTDQVRLKYISFDNLSSHIKGSHVN